MTKMNPIRLRALSVSIALAVVSPAQAGDVLGVEEFHRLQPQTGVFVIEGYLTDVYRCGPCLPGATCKRCAGNFVILASVNSPPTYRNVSVNGALASVMNHPEKYLRIDMAALRPWRLSSDPPGNAEYSLTLNQKYRATLEVDTRFDRRNMQWLATTTWHAKDIKPVDPP